MRAPQAGAEVERRPRPTAAGLTIILGGIAAMLLSFAHITASACVVAIGASTTAAGIADRANRWMLGLGLPILGTGLGIATTQIIPPLSGYATTAVFVALGAGVVLGVRAGKSEWAVTGVLWFIAVGFASLLIASPQSAGSPRVLWVFGAGEALLGVVLLTGIAPRAANVAGRVPAPSVDPGPPLLLRAAVLFAGAVGVSLVDRLGHNLYLVVLALGVAYLVPGVATRHHGWAESGALIMCLGVAIVLTDAAPVVITGIQPLVFAATAVAATLIRGFRLGSVQGIGRSLIVIGAVLAALAALPSAGPSGVLRTNLDVVLPALPVASASAVLVRWWLQRLRTELVPGDVR